jgi:hypothetical protein
MDAIKLSLVPDPTLPVFKRLHASLNSRASLEDVFLRGTYPWGSCSSSYQLVERFVKILNDDRFKIDALAKFGLCNNYATSSRRSRDFVEVLGEINRGICFVNKDFTYQELLSLVKVYGKENWCHDTVWGIIQMMFRAFNDIRDFIKAKDKSVSFSSYDDIQKYNLSSIFGIEDFEAEEKYLIEAVLPSLNIRSEDFLAEVVDDNNNLRLSDNISCFLSHVGTNNNLLYNGIRSGTKVRFYPTLGFENRTLAASIAKKYGGNTGKYCFTLSIDDYEKLIDGHELSISFSSVPFRGDPEKEALVRSSSSIKNSSVPTYSVFSSRRFSWRYNAVSNKSIQTVLSHYGISMTGRKEELVDKLANLCAKMYNEKKDEMDKYFTANKFIKANGSSNEVLGFPVIDDVVHLQHALLKMYIAKHLRGNVILDATYENDAYDLTALAKSMIEGETTVDYGFVRVV